MIELLKTLICYVTISYFVGILMNMIASSISNSMRVISALLIPFIFVSLIIAGHILYTVNNDISELIVDICGDIYKMNYRTMNDCFIDFTLKLVLPFVMLAISLKFASKIDSEKNKIFIILIMVITFVFMIEYFIAILVSLTVIASELITLAEMRMPKNKNK